MRLFYSRLAFFGLLVAGTTAFQPSALRGAGADDDAGPLLAAVRSAVDDGRLEATRELGFTLGKKQFREAPGDGGFLTGLDVGVGKFMDIENVYAVRANYWTAQGDVRLQEHGHFRDRRLPNGKVIKTKVLRTVHIQAPPGYAVGGLTVRSGLNINGLSVTFMKINGAALDPGQALESDWVGDRTGGGEATLDGKGAPVANLFGRQDDEKVTALGLIFATPPVAAEAPVAVHPVAPPPSPPPARVVERPQPKIAEAEPAAAPPEIEADPVPAEPAVAAKETVVAPPAEEWPLWASAGIPAVVFLLVGGLCFLGVLTSWGRQAPPTRKTPGRRENVRPAKNPSAPPAGFYVAPSSRAVVAAKEVIELRDEDVLPAPAAADKPLLDALPLEPVLIRKAGAAAVPTSSASKSWPRLEV